MGRYSAALSLLTILIATQCFALTAELISSNGPPRTPRAGRITAGGRLSKAPSTNPRAAAGTPGHGPRKGHWQPGSSPERISFDNPN